VHDKNNTERLLNVQVKLRHRAPIVHVVKVIMSVCRYLVRAFFSALKGGGALSNIGASCVTNWLAKQASAEACGGANREGGVMEGGQGELEGR
jgi:hypothetical protein